MDLSRHRKAVTDLSHETKAKCDDQIASLTLRSLAKSPLGDRRYSAFLLRVERLLRQFESDPTR